ncbi:MAG TPA: peroxiredoxin [Dehalococcoidia bacterium]|nr:peroxiredoxin [Dehalococcoidia bacterium]
MLDVGSPAPDFSAPLDTGETFTLADWRGKKNVVLYFYPKDNTRGCTQEACTFRDNYDEIGKYDAIIVGVSSDSVESHQGFREKHNLPFPLIADTDKRVSKLYDARGLFGFMTARVTYVIDKDGVIRDAFRHEMAIGDHLRDVLAALEKMTSAAPS